MDIGYVAAIGRKRPSGKIADGSRYGIRLENRRLAAGATSYPQGEVAAWLDAVIGWRFHE
jgi:hypothetical protein